jgi:hypothetical protein
MHKNEGIPYLFLVGGGDFSLPARSRSRLREAPASAGVGRSAKAGRLNYGRLKPPLPPGNREGVGVRRKGFSILHP